MQKPRISLIAALSENHAIGKDGKIPWYIPEDFAHFKQITLGHPIIMGRKTFESIGRVLPKRLNIIITRDQEYQVGGATVVHSLNEALDLAAQHDQEEIFVIGGGQVFKEAIEKADRLYLTIVKVNIDGADAFFPPYDSFRNIIENETHTSSEYTYQFLTLDR